MITILYNIYRILMYPTSLITGIIAYIKIVNIYIDDIKNNDKYNILTKKSVFIAANQRIINNPQEVNDYVNFLIDRMGIIRYILPIVFWIFIFNLIF